MQIIKTPVFIRHALQAAGIFRHQITLVIPGKHMPVQFYALNVRYIIEINDLIKIALPGLF